MPDRLQGDELQNNNFDQSTFSSALSKESERKRTAQTRLRQWPCKINMLPATAPYLDGAELLIAADCSAYAYADFHEHFMKKCVTLIGCPCDDTDALKRKLERIFKENDISSVTAVSLDAACCEKMESTIENAIKASNTSIPLKKIKLSTDGSVII